MSTSESIANSGSKTFDIAKGVSAIGSIFAIIDRQREIKLEDANGIEIKKTIGGSIELKEVFFAYPTRPNYMILKGLSLKIEARKTMALVGQSGFGKLTIIGLIERFYNPLEGTILIDKHDNQELQFEKIKVKYCIGDSNPPSLQELFMRTLSLVRKMLQNLKMKATALANAHESISSMNDGYDNYCGEGVQLQRDQKQRIALAKAILKDLVILLLDEATSGLDSLSENLVKTCVIVAHCLSTIQKADSIAVIRDGKVAEIGSHDYLPSMGPHSAYYSLTKLQDNHSIYM